jgi:uncharacterized membrane protein
VIGCCDLQVTNVKKTTGETTLSDKAHRSLIKAISWRVTGTIDTVLVSFLVTGRIKLALSIGCVELFTKVGLYYLHERIWNKISFGRAKPKEDFVI